MSKTKAKMSEMLRMPADPDKDSWDYVNELRLRLPDDKIIAILKKKDTPPLRVIEKMEADLEARKRKEEDDKRAGVLADIFGFGPWILILGAILWLTVRGCME